MKQTTLEDLFYGNISPNEISFVKGSEYGKCFDKVTELSKSVCSQQTEHKYPHSRQEYPSTSSGDVFESRFFDESMI